MVVPYVDGGDLFELLSSHPGGLPEEKARLYFQQIVSGLLHLKGHHLTHG